MTRNCRLNLSAFTDGGRLGSDATEIVLSLPPSFNVYNLPDVQNVLGQLLLYVRTDAFLFEFNDIVRQIVFIALVKKQLLCRQQLITSVKFKNDGIKIFSV